MPKEVILNGPTLLIKRLANGYHIVEMHEESDRDLIENVALTVEQLVIHTKSWAESFEPKTKVFGMPDLEPTKLAKTKLRRPRKRIRDLGDY